MNQTNEPNQNGKNLVLSPILAPFAQIWAKKFFLVDFTCTGC